jgi:[protein-PII] uridylyltransferase
MFLVDPALTKGAAERDAKDLIRRLSQQMWDCGLRLAPTTRTAVECERFQPENVEFTLALLDARFVAGDRELFDRLAGRTIPKLLDKQHTKIVKRLAEVTWVRHRRYGNTLFHLEPNIKDCPGGLRDAHVCAWMKRLEGGSRGIERFGDEYRQAREFLLLTRAFLHLRHGRDDNTLDWHAQDQAAGCSGCGLLDADVLPPRTQHRAGGGAGAGGGCSPEAGVTTAGDDGGAATERTACGSQ